MKKGRALAILYLILLLILFIALAPMELIVLVMEAVFYAFVLGSIFVAVLYALFDR